MNSLFSRSYTDTPTNLPFMLPNLALIGDKVRNFKVKYTSSPHIQKGRHDINVPDYVITKDEINKQVLLRASLWRMKLFYNMNFKNKTVLNYSAQLIFSYRVAEVRKNDLLGKMYGKSSWRGRSVAHQTIKKTRERIESGTYTKEDKQLMDLYDSPTIPIGSEEDVYMYVVRLINELYETNDVHKFISDFVKKYACVQDGGVQATRMESTILNVVRTKVDFKMPEHIIEQDSSIIFQAYYTATAIVREAQYYARRMEITKGAWKKYWNEDEKEYRHGWVYDKLSETQVRYRVNKIRRILEGKVSNNRRNIPDGLPSKRYEDDTPQPEQEYALTLPKGLGKELALEVMEDADRKHQHLVDYEREVSSGVHGKAKLIPFKPDESVDKAIRELKKSSSDRGVVPRSMHRMATDRKVFSRRTTVAGGSMMIDCSGSMGLYKDDIKEIVELLPASNIAGYVGYNRKIDDYDGEIRVIAKDGRMSNHALDKLDEWGANSVDLEGLRWLATQPEPRIWVSDQQVIGVNADTGRNDYLDGQKRKEISVFMRKNNIIPIERRETILKVAKKLSLKH